MTYLDQLLGVGSVSRLYASVFHRCRTGIAVADARGTILEVNAAFAAVTGFSRHEVVGRDPRSLWPRPTDADSDQDVMTALREQGAWDGEIRIRRKTGEERSEYLSIEAIQDPKGSITHYVGIFADERLKKEMVKSQRLQDELTATNLRLSELARMDPLTELLNRRGFQQVLSYELRRGRREGSESVVILVDLDDFKQINDALGHGVGDLVIKEVAQKMSSALRSTDYVARIGGDEFMALLPQTNAAEGAKVAEKLRLSLSGSPVLLSPKPVTVTASLGAVKVIDVATSIDELLAELHLVLHESKQSGKNRVTYAWRGVRRSGDADVELTNMIDRLRAGRELHAVSQPIYSLDDERPVGVEFLSRSAIRGFEQPDDFFRVCTEMEILPFVDQHCFKMCLDASRSFDPKLRLHLNLFPSTLIEMPIDDLIDCFPENRENGAYCVEISEQQVIGDPSYLLEPVRALKQAGIRIAFDDVGFGRSWLESLVLLEPHTIKIDKSRVNGISDGFSSTRSFHRLLKIADILGAEVVAEGIESRADLEVLRDLGVKYGQGFLWGRPN